MTIPQVKEKWNDVSIAMYLVSDIRNACAATARCGICTVSYSEGRFRL